MSTGGYPAAPWPLPGQMWGSLFPVPALRASPWHLRGRVRVLRAREPPDLLRAAGGTVARRHAGPGHRHLGRLPRLAGGRRELWAIPKELADFGLDTRHTGPVARTEWSARVPPAPSGAARWRRPGSPTCPGPASACRCAAAPGSRRWCPAGRASGRDRGLRPGAPRAGDWELDADGPLGWLRGARQLGSFRLCDFRLSFG